MKKADIEVKEMITTTTVGRGDAYNQQINRTYYYYYWFID